MIVARSIVTILLFTTLCASGLAAESTKYASHHPQRPLPVAVDRPLAQGVGKFVDAQKGDDAQSGSREQPWRTVQHAVKQLKAGETLYLRGGVYHEHVVAQLKGESQQPITIRSYPGELAILDGGLLEFLTSPAAAWEPVTDGASGEYRSVKQYPSLNVRPEGVHVLGRFADSMTPLHGYSLLGDLRSDNIYWNLESKVGKQEFIYCGPGLFYDPKTERIHVRLAPTRMPYLPKGDNYEGETDPRKLALVVAALTHGPALTLHGSQYVRMFDIVVRGAAGPTFNIDDCVQVVLDGVTAYGGSNCVRVVNTAGLRVLNTACRGIAAPWTFRGSLKYRAIEARIFNAGGWAPTARGNRDFELASSEFTDSVDGVFIGNVAKVKFHHNLLDNVSDDGMFLTSGTTYDGLTPGGGHEITLNRFSRCLTTFAFGVGHGRQKVLDGRTQTGADLWITRNVFDFREPVPYHQPRSPGEKEELTSFGRLAGDHGSPAWEPMAFYHNTVLLGESPFRSIYAGGLGGSLGGGATRRLFNNLFVTVQGSPGSVLPEVQIGKGTAGSPNLQADGNGHWSLDANGFDTSEFTRQLQRTANSANERTGKKLGWAEHDVIADPGLTQVNPRPQPTDDLRLTSQAKAVNQGVAIESSWLDPLRAQDTGVPDLGALPLGVEAWQVGVRSRLNVFGVSQTPATSLPADVAFLELINPPAPWQASKPTVIVSGYPAPDVPLFEFALEQQGIHVETLERTWLPPSQYQNYSVVALVGDLVRAKIEPSTFTEADLKLVEKFLHDGGTLVLLTRGKEAFRTQHGMAWMSQRLGWERLGTAGVITTQLADHPWTKHLGEGNRGWLTSQGGKNENLLKVRLGERILADTAGHTILYRQPMGKGQLIYVGWSIAAALPATRDRKSNVDNEANYEAQMHVLKQLLASGVAK